jgi:hypothetical protein
MIYADE